MGKCVCEHCLYPANSACGLVSGPGKHRVKTGCTQEVAHQARSSQDLFRELREAAPLCPKKLFFRELASTLSPSVPPSRSVSSW